MIRVLVAEDQALLRGALCEILALDPDLDVVAQCASGHEVLAAARKSNPDVAVMDIDMPGMDGLEAAQLLTRDTPAIRTLMLTVFGRPGYLQRAVANGALGFILKDTPPPALIEAIKRTANGERVVDGELAVAALARGDCPLTVREREVLSLSRTVASTGELANALHLSDGTIRNALSAAIQKLQASNRAQAAQIAEHNGWL